MRWNFRFVISAVFIVLIGVRSAAIAQVVTATVPVTYPPTYSAVNPNTNTAYVLSATLGIGTVNVINANTLSVQTVNVGYNSHAIAGNWVTNKIYVVNSCGDSLCSTNGNLMVIDGTTLSVRTVQLGRLPTSVAVNSVTNKIYVVFVGGVAVIDGNTLALQTVTTAPLFPSAIAVNSVTNKIYAVFETYVYGWYGFVLVVDGATLATQTVVVGIAPVSVAVDTSTNEIFVSNACGQILYQCSQGTVTAIQGNTLASYQVSVGYSPGPIAANAITQQVFVANDCGDDPRCLSNGTVTDIDEGTLTTTSIGVQIGPQDVEIDPAANKIYVSNFASSTVTAVDGATLSAFPVAVGNGPSFMAVNSQTHQIFVPAETDGSVSIITGDAKLQLVNIAPCRLVDTRQQNGSGPILGGTYQNFLIPQLGGCNIPTSAAEYALNITVVPHGSLSYLTVWPEGQRMPDVSLMNSLDGRVKANAATVQPGVSGGISIFASNTTDVIVDINGYYAPASQQTYEFYPLPPCRVADTRNANGNLGGPYLTGGVERDFQVLASSCIPPNLAIQAYSFNFTAIPHPEGQPLGYLTVWPVGEQKPVVSTLNNPTGTYVANAAIVSAGTNGGIAVYPDQNTDLAIDINGYFAVAGQGGLSLYPSSLCRVINTQFLGNGQPFSGELTVNVANSICLPASTSQAYIFNATVVPSPTLGYLTLWADGENQPAVSTLNAADGSVTSNMAIVPTLNGSVDAFAAGTTELILDISGFFAP